MEGCLLQKGEDPIQKGLNSEVHPTIGLGNEDKDLHMPHLTHSRNKKPLTMDKVRKYKRNGQLCGDKEGIKKYHNPLISGVQHLLLVCRINNIYIICMGED